MTLHALEVLMIDGADINFALNNLEGKSNPAAAVALLYSFFFLTGCSPGFAIPAEEIRRRDVPGEEGAERVSVVPPWTLLLFWIPGWWSSPGMSCGPHGWRWSCR